MKGFKDLNFEPHTAGIGWMTREHFDNGYGVSVVRTPYSYGGKIGLYELAVLDSEGNICYTTPLTSDVVGYLRPEDVTDAMQRIQKL